MMAEIEASAAPPPPPPPPVEPVMTEAEVIAKVADLMEQAARLEGEEKFADALDKLNAVKKFDPTRGVKLPRHTVKAPKPLTKAEAERLLKAISVKTVTGKRDKAIVTLMLTTGLRLGECLALNTGDITKQGRHWVLEIRGKGNGVETVKLLPKVKRVIDAYVKARGTATPLFTSIRGTRLKARGVQLRLAQYGEKAGLQRRVSPHDLRHTFARLSHQNGADVLLIQEALRHKSLETTQVYLSRMARLDKSAFDLMPTLV